MDLWIILSYISLAFNVYSYMLVGYVLMSWVPAIQDSAVGRFLKIVCEPYLSIFRKFIPPIGMIDISPIVAIFLLNFIKNGLFIVIQKIFFMF
ncbi:YggT family protein [Lysinibacillus sp. CNPSo 3705]|uniref:YggT family protein n=1 Tax=Lysinibacillus sp. CNPSo 3705 TaxID=3028148 RepID=UPI001052D586|nr:YggT family protein [Lysinibacillus sp. CNPSo 3705]MDD1502718.1 YggT family protein [Lysinibacillus sp. CNPSo 3705]